MRKTLFITLTIALFLFIATIPAQAAEDGDIGCYTATFTGHTPYGYTVSDKTHDEIRHAVVGHYLWIQFAATTWDDTGPVNTVSIDVDGVQAGDTVRICTTYVAEGIIPTGPGTGWTVTASESSDGGAPSAGVVHVVASTLSPHPSIAEAWIADNGLVIL